jgi:N,N'-diacetyllegionaminate synthase
MSRVQIIAEAGVNHNGDIIVAKRLVDEAKRCGADIVKFQTFDPKKLASKYAVMAEYQKQNLGIEESQIEMLGRLTLREEDYIELSDYCRNIGIEFLSTPFDTKSVHFLNNLQSIWKIPSGEITNYPYLVEIAKTGKDIILSTGMSTIEDVDAAIKVLIDNGAGKITLLHCTTNYPTPMEDVNLKAMITLKERYRCSVGYSDHTNGIEVPIAAVAMGASVIEKHFTLDRSMSGPDHKASLEPNELKAMVDAIRNIELALGDGIKVPAESEMKNMNIARKSIIAAKPIKKGEILSDSNLTTKRPGTGISPMLWNSVLGTKAVRDFDEDELIEI